MPERKRIVIIGATSAIAEHCARLWVQETAADLVLVGRDSAKMEKISADLLVRSPASSINQLTVDFLDPVKIQIFADDIASGGRIDIILIAHGFLPEQEACQNDLSLNRKTLNINAVSPALFAEAFAGHMEKAGFGALAVIGSVAGDRSRRSNYVYGAAKGLITRYVQGLQHRLATSASGVKVVLIKPGPVDTPMTANLKEKKRMLAPVENVAADIVKGISRGQPVIYTPAKWSLIMLIVRHLPNFIFKRINI